MTTITRKKDLLRLLKGVSAAIICCMALACSKMDDIYKDYIKDGEIRYSKKPDSIGIYPGLNRAKVWMLVSSYDVSKGKVYWNERADSVEFPIQRSNKPGDTVGAVVEGIPEGTYTFEFITYDKAGNPSLPVDTTGEVMGEAYLSSLSNRLASSAELRNGTVRITWYDESKADAIGTEVRYKDQLQADHLVQVGREEGETRIPERPLGDSVLIRNVYLPNKDAIDTFYAAYETIYLTSPQPVALDKSKFAEWRLPTDAPGTHYSSGMSLLWDGLTTDQSMYGAETGSGSPHWFTFDMGVKAALNRLVLWQRPGSTASPLFYTNANVRLFEIWGSNDPDPDGSWDGWVKLMDGESHKPSGLPLGQLSAEDINYAKQGETYVFPDGLSSVRYLRIKVLDTWNPAEKQRSFLSELTLYGIPE